MLRWIGSVAHLLPPGHQGDAMGWVQYKGKCIPEVKRDGEGGFVPSRVDV